MQIRQVKTIKSKIRQHGSNWQEPNIIAAKRFVTRKEHELLVTQLFKLGVSWGGHESLIVPGEVVLEQKARPNSAHEFGLSANSVRVHIGLEGTEALWADLTVGFAAAQ